MNVLTTYELSYKYFHRHIIQYEKMMCLLCTFKNKKALDLLPNLYKPIL